MTDKKVRENGDNDSIRDGNTEGGIKGVAWCGGERKGENRKQTWADARGRQQIQENVLQTQEVVIELGAS
jgi:hypothetical protein